VITILFWSCTGFFPLLSGHLRPPMTSAPASFFGALANSGPVALSFPSTNSFGSFLEGGGSK
jgi:hypothetical protein